MHRTAPPCIQTGAWQPSAARHAVPCLAGLQQGCGCSIQPQAAPPTCMPHEAASLNQASNSCMGPASAIWQGQAGGKRGCGVLVSQLGRAELEGQQSETLPCTSKHCQSPCRQAHGRQTQHSHIQLAQAPPWASVAQAVAPNHTRCTAPAQAGHLLHPSANQQQLTSDSSKLCPPLP